MASLAQTLRTKSNEVRYEKYSKSSNKEDIELFFNYIKNDAVNKMQIRAAKGYNSANILEYSYVEHFYIDNKEIIRTPKYSKPTNENAKSYRIFEVVRTTEFKELLDNYQKELGEDMEIAVWWPGGNINVIEAIWGPTKYHRKNNNKYTPAASTQTNIKDDTIKTEKPEKQNKNTHAPSSAKSSYASIAKSPKKDMTINFNDDEE
jgi:hypothetical protein